MDKKVIVNFERPTEEEFDSARCELTSYTWLYKEGIFLLVQRLICPAIFDLPLN